MPITLDRVVPWGRTLDEYERMFALSEADWRGAILGCGDGPASFNAEATQRGARVVSCDPIYAFSAAQIEARVRETYEVILRGVRENYDDFVWDDIASPEALGERRLGAMRRFLEDYQTERGGRYVAAQLPQLPFREGAFDLALVSHFLILYSAQLDYEFHRRALGELLRVAREVRVFPLLALGNAPSPHLAPLMTEFAGRGFVVKEQKVDYEFQRGGDRMLSIAAPLLA